MFGYNINASNVNEALPLGILAMRQFGVATDSRAGPVLRIPGPVITTYRNPAQRVLFGRHRDANPFFHLFDALWMLSGSNAVSVPALFLPRIVDFSDDGQSFHGAYGHRLRYAQEFDQIEAACAALGANPGSRQVVLSIWDPVLDLGAVTKDMPCNDMIMLDIVAGELNMTVCNRSNDMIWGAYGANAVQFSVLQEYMAAMLEVKVGRYVQMSNNFHVYVDNPYWKSVEAGVWDPTHISDPYQRGEGTPLATSPQDAFNLYRDCVYLAHCVEKTVVPYEAVDLPYQSTFFAAVALPMLLAWMEYKTTRNFEVVQLHLENVQSWDWRVACSNWMMRRAEKAGA